MSTTNEILASAAGLAHSEVISGGDTATAAANKNIAFVMPLFGDATVSAITNGPSGLTAPFVLSQDVAYPILCKSITLDAGSTGKLFVSYV